MLRESRTVEMNQNGKIEWELNLAGTPIPGTPALPLAVRGESLDSLVKFLA